MIPVIREDFVWRWSMEVHSSIVEYCLKRREDKVLEMDFTQYYEMSQTLDLIMDPVMKALEEKKESKPHSSPNSG